MRKRTTWLVLLGLGVLSCGIPGPLQARPQQSSSAEGGSAPSSTAGSSSQHSDQQLPGRITGTVVDQTGAVVPGARVRLTRDAQSPVQEVLTDEDGQFSFFNLAPGPFQLAIASPGFANRTASGRVSATESAADPTAGMQATKAARRRPFTMLSPWGEDQLCSAADR